MKLSVFSGVQYHRCNIILSVGVCNIGSQSRYTCMVLKRTHLCSPFYNLLRFYMSNSQLCSIRCVDLHCILLYYIIIFYIYSTGFPSRLHSVVPIRGLHWPDMVSPLARHGVSILQRVAFIDFYTCNSVKSSI